jgi:hypothetical protein
MRQTGIYDRSKPSRHFMPVGKRISYPEFYNRTSISYDKVLDLVNERKIKASFLNGELFINEASMVKYIETLDDDHYSKTHWRLYGKSKV